MKNHKQIFAVIILSVISCACMLRLFGSKNSCYAASYIMKDGAAIKKGTEEISEVLALADDFYLDRCNKTKEELLNGISGDMLGLTVDIESRYPLTYLNLVAIDKNKINRFGCEDSGFKVFEHLDPNIKMLKDSNIIAAFFCKDDGANGNDQLICKKNLEMLSKDNRETVRLYAQFCHEKSDSKLADYARNEPDKKMVIKIYKNEVKDENFLGESEEFSFNQLKEEDLLFCLKQFPSFDSSKISKWLGCFKTYFKNEDRLLTPTTDSSESFKQSWDVVNFAFNKTKSKEITLNFNILPVKNTPENVLSLNEKVENCKIFENIKPKPNGKSNITMAIFTSPTGLKRDEKLIYSDELDLVKNLENDDQPILGKTLSHETLHDFAQSDLPKSLIIRFYNSEKFDSNNPNQGLIGVFGDTFCTDEKIEIVPTPEPQDQLCKIRDSYRTNRDNLLINSQFDQNYSCDFVFKRRQNGTLSLLLNLFVFNDTQNFDRFTKIDSNLSMAIFNNDEDELKLMYKNKFKPVLCDVANKTAIFSLEIAPSDLTNLIATTKNEKTPNNQLVMKFYDGDVSFDLSDADMQKLISADLEQNLIGSFAGGTHDRTFSIKI